VVFPDRKTYRISYTDEMMDVVQKLLMKDRTKRLGANGGVDEIMSHPWFASINIEKLE
jgi:hypothetical protein